MQPWFRVIKSRYVCKTELNGLFFYTEFKIGGRRLQTTIEII